MMSSREIHSLVHFDGWVIPDRIEQGSTYRAWNNMNKAVKKGALWGDFAVYTAQELFEVLEERANYRRLYKSKEPDTKEPDTKEPEVKELEAKEPSVQLVERAPSALTSFETYPEPVKEPVKEQFKERPQAKPKQTLAQKLDKFAKIPPRPLCLGCGMYCVNSKPPDSWSAGDRKRYCCLECRDARGKKHAPRCQKHKPL